MASLLKLGVDTGQWDAGLKKAQSALNAFTQSQGGLQKALEKESKDMQSFVQMMGKMDSTANTAKGQMNDYKRSIEQLSGAFNQMSAAQKASIGQDYLHTIDALKQKFQAAKQQVDELNRSLNDIKAPDIELDGGESMFGGDGFKGMLQVFGGNMMTKAAGFVANLGSEVVTVMNESAELARQAEGVQIAFARLGDGSILNELREATHGTVSDLELMKAAVKFNDFKLPVEELGTMLAFAQQKAKDTGQSVDYMVDSIVTGLGRKSLMILDNLGLSATEIRERMKETGDMTKAVGEIIRDQMSKAGDYVETAADRATQANVELENAMLELGNAMRETFGYSGWSEMATGIKTELVGAITFTIETVGEAKRAFKELLSLKDRIFGSTTKAIKDGINNGKGNQPPADGTYYETTDSSGAILGSGRWLNGRQVQTGYGEYVVTGNKHDENKKKTTRTTTTTTPAQQAAKSIEAAEQEYARALEKAALEVQGGTISEAQQKQKQLAATEALWTAYGKASDTVGGTNTEYKKRQDELGQQIVSLGGETKSLQEAQKQAEEAYRQVAAQTQKMATAQEEANRAIGSGDLKAFYAADRKLTAAGGKSAATGMDMSQVFGATQANVDAFIDSLKQQISQSELGTDLYNNLTAQLADTQALSNLLQVAIKNGIDPAQIGLVPEEFWKKIFGENPGDYINPETWKAIVDNLNEYIHKNGGSNKKVKLDVNTGNVTEKEDKTAQEQLTAMNTMINSLGSIASGVQNLGIEVPAGIMQGIAVLQTIMGIVSAIQTMQAVGTFLGIFHNGGIVHAANGWAGTVPGNSYSNDQIPIMANAGEVVLTHAMAGNLASQLNDGGMQNIQLEAVISGEQIMLASNNRGRRTGRGEIVQSRRVR